MPVVHSGSQVSGEQPGDGRIEREQRKEMKAATQCRVDLRDTAIRGIHGSQNDQILWQSEGDRSAPMILKLHWLVAILKREKEFAEHAGQVRAIDFVDDQDVLFVLCFLDGLQQRARLTLESGRAAFGDNRTIPLDKILIGIRGVELNEGRLPTIRQEPCQCPRNVSLTGARWTVKDQLRFDVKKSLDMIHLIQGLPKEFGS